MKKVVVAEDDFPSREMIGEMLEIFGYEVILASNGQEALECIERSNPDLVLLDIQMPVMDGISTGLRIRDSERPSIPVAALTALAMAGDREKALAAGFDAYFTKPIAMNDLRENVHRLLNTGEARRGA